MGCVSCYFHQPWGCLGVSWEIPPLVGLSYSRCLFLLLYTQNTWLGHADHCLARHNAQAGLDICQDLVSVLAFQKKDNLGVIMGWAVWQGSLHCQHGFNSTVRVVFIWLPTCSLLCCLLLSPWSHSSFAKTCSCLNNQSFPLPLLILLGGCVSLCYLSLF